MWKRLLFIAMAAIFALAVGFADQSNGKVIIPVGKTNPADGKQMFTSYCAPCHGVDGRGQGPAASALRQQPTDLTGLAKANHGKYQTRTSFPFCGLAPMYPRTARQRCPFGE